MPILLMKVLWTFISRIAVFSLSVQPISKLVNFEIGPTFRFFNSLYNNELKKSNQYGGSEKW